MAPRVVVIGAGVIGLSTAVQIQEALPAADVTVVADKFTTDTVSDGAAGLFRPTADYIPGLPRQLLKQWCVDSWNHYSSLAHSPEASDAGVGVVSGYHYFSPGQEEKDPMHKEITYFSRDFSEKDFRNFPGVEHCRSGFAYTTLIVECRWYQPWLMKRFQSNGGKVEKKTIHSLEEIADKYDVIVNCAGARANQLVSDDLLQPIRGQMIRVQAPWIKHFLYVDHNCWIIPGKESVTIGGTRQEGNTDPEVSPADSQEVWERACRYMPSLRRAKWLWQWVGMRPVRRPVRLEKEARTFGNRTVQIVHNYGHGGNGVSLSWGCGTHAARLVSEGYQSKL